MNTLPFSRVYLPPLYTGALRTSSLVCHFSLYSVAAGPSASNYTQKECRFIKACGLGQLDVVKSSILEEGLRMDLQDPDGWQPLHIAVLKVSSGT